MFLLLQTSDDRAYELGQAVGFLVIAVALLAGSIWLYRRAKRRK